MEPVTITIWPNTTQWKGPVTIRTDGSDLDIICKMYPMALVKRRRPYRVRRGTLVECKYLSECKPSQLHLMR